MTILTKPTKKGATFAFPRRFFQECTPLFHTAQMASWFTFTSTPSWVTVNENATAEWASAILNTWIIARIIEVKNVLYSVFFSGDCQNTSVKSYKRNYSFMVCMFSFLTLSKPWGPQAWNFGGNKWSHLKKKHVHFITITY